MKSEVIVIAGPTAIGKTAYAIDLAKKVGGQLINVDSRQVYKYLDIGTNKGNLKEAGDITVDNKKFPVHLIDGVKIHFLSFLNPNEVIDAFSYRDIVFKLMLDLLIEDITPILVGGSGMYLNVIINHKDFKASSAKSEELRSELENLSKEELQEKLMNLSSEIYDYMNLSDRENKRRLIRLLEIHMISSEESDEKFPDLDFSLRYINADIEYITKRIQLRVDSMLQEGLIDEVRNVLSMGYKETDHGINGIGYREVICHLKGEINYNELKDKIAISHRQYAKKQITWFNKFYLPKVKPENIIDV